MKISIITVCFNSEKTIEDTIKSVLSQTYQNYEYLIIDGKSSDNTLNIVKKYEPLFKGKMKWISEKDSGLYDAMNKGIKMTTGDVIGILNSDDILASENIFKTVIENWDSKTDIIYANVMYYNNDFTKVIRDYISGTKKNDAWCPAHPSMYVSKNVFNIIGLYNTEYKVCADYDFMVRCNIKNISYKYINEYFVFMRYGGTSNGIKGYINNLKDCLIILRSHNIKYSQTKLLFRVLKTLFQILGF